MNSTKDKDALKFKQCVQAISMVKFVFREDRLML
jgi:hypothetical protein